MSDSIYYWQFVSASGDMWRGVTYANTNTYYVGQAWNTGIITGPGSIGAGYYQVYNEVPQRYDYGWQGQNAVYAYYDAGTRAWYTPDLYASSGLSGGFGIGNEYDSITFYGRDRDTFGMGGGQNVAEWDLK